MAIVAIDGTIAAGTVTTFELVVGRKYLKRLCLFIQDTIAAGDVVGFRINNHGQSVAPVQSFGSAKYIPVNVNGVLFDFMVDYELNGPPFSLELEFSSNAAGPLDFGAWLELYNTPYAQTRVFVPPGMSRDVEGAVIETPGYLAKRE
jgi:hypothetical protein